MKSFYKLIFLSMLCTSLNAQINLVPNGDFELYDNCPSGPNQVYHCIGWSSASDSTVNNQTPDYWNVCSNANYITPPNVIEGYQVPRSGNGYCGIGCYVIPIGGNHNVREYIQADLIDTLIPNVKYYVSFYANLSGAPLYAVGTNKLGALFTTNKFVGPNFAMPLNFAQVYEDSVLTDTAGWYHFKVSFIADSNYRYMTIGNFFDDAHTDTISINGNNALISYYYIDDVCVSTDSILCYSIMAIQNITQQQEDFFPNPADDAIHFSIYNHLSDNVFVYNTMGQLIELSKIEKSDNKINCSAWEEGLYFVKLNHKSFKIIVQHK